MSSSEGHILSRLQIAKHGRDRYPTIMGQAIKVMIEACELVDAIDQAGLDHQGAGCAMVPPEVTQELADTALALFALGDKLGIDVIETMRALVDADQRDFT